MRLLIPFFVFIIFTWVLNSNAQLSIPAHRDRHVKITTNLGEMVFKLHKETPKHHANFVRLVKKRYFDAYDFNRIIKGFVVQGGETDSAYAAMEKAGQVLERLPAELNPKLFHQKGALAAGRDDNKEKASFLGQIYVVDGKKYTDQQLDAFEKRIGKDFHFSAEARGIYKEIGGTPSLDQNYTIFGQLVKGWEVLDRIAGQSKDKSDRPLIKIKIKVSMLSKKEVHYLYHLDE